MSLHSKIVNESKLDSRRFGKSIVCRIVHGKLLAFMAQKRLIPQPILTKIHNETGLDPINNKMAVIPVPKYKNIEELLTNYDSAVLEAVNPNEKIEDVESIAKIQDALDAITTAIQQNMILITMSSLKPEGRLAGLSPEAYDVMIDSNDVNQAIEATYVFRNVRKIREVKQTWDKK